MDRNINKILVDETINTKGWAVIEDEINRIIGTAQASLVTTDPSNSIAIAKLQEKVNTLKKTLQIVYNMVK